MASDELIEYVKKSLADGFPQREIKNALKNTGYEEDDILHAFEVAKLSEALPEKITEKTFEFKQEPKGYFSKLKKIFFSPKNFFSEIGHERGFTEPLTFLAINLLIVSIVFSVLFLLLANLIFSIYPELGLFDLSLPLVVATYFISVLTGGVAASVIAAGIMHLVTIGLGGQAEFEDAFKIIAYSSAPILPGVFIMWIPVIGAVGIAAWQFALIILGLSSAYHISKGRAALIEVLMILLGILLGLIFVVLGAV